MESYRECMIPGCWSRFLSDVLFVSIVSEKADGLQVHCKSNRHIHLNFHTNNQKILILASGSKVLIQSSFKFYWFFPSFLGTFEGRPADYFFMLLFNWISCVIIGLLMNIPVSFYSTSSKFIYLFCMLDRLFRCLSFSADQWNQETKSHKSLQLVKSIVS